jgi:hypothetical protein
MRTEKGGKIVVQIGMLNLKGNELSFRPLGKDTVERDVMILEPGATFEIQLGAVWIHFVTREGNRCGFVPGMVARLFL